MRKRRKRGGGLAAAARPVLALALAALAVRALWAGAELLGAAGESAAIISAAILLPDGSGPMLRERFRAEIYNPEGEQATGESEQGEPLPPPPEPEQPPPNESEPSAHGESSAGPIVQAPRVPPEYAAPIISEDFSGSEGGMSLRFGAGLIKNETDNTNEQIGEILETPWPVQLEDTGEPQVLLLHTHTTESFEKYDTALYDIRNTWRSTDNRGNMAAVGDAMARTLERRGVAVIHDTTQHDYPSYNGSYERSAETIRAYLEEYPSIKVVLDLHRDAMQRDDAIVKPVAVIDGKKAAQIMIIAACDDEGYDVPEWRENLRLAAAFQDSMESAYPGLTRPVYLCYRKYNMDITTGSLLLEFGSNANTLDEAVYSAELAGEALADLIEQNRLDTWD